MPESKTINDQQLKTHASVGEIIIGNSTDSLAREERARLAFQQAPAKTPSQAPIDKPVRHCTRIDSGLDVDHNTPWSDELKISSERAFQK